MEKPRITINGTEHVMRDLKGRDWRLLGQFAQDAPSYVDIDFIEKNAAFVAQFFDVTADDILDMPLEDILPTALAVRKAIGDTLAAKMEKIEKNAEKDVKNTE